MCTSRDGCTHGTPVKFGLGRNGGRDVQVTESLSCLMCIACVCGADLPFRSRVVPEWIVWLHCVSVHVCGCVRNVDRQTFVVLLDSSKIACVLSCWYVSRA